MLVSREESQSGFGMGSLGEAVSRAEARSIIVVLMMTTASRLKNFDEEAVPLIAMSPVDTFLGCGSVNKPGCMSGTQLVINLPSPRERERERERKREGEREKEREREREGEKKRENQMHGV